jgi:uncharacterized delta-60 repeat protein
VKVTTTIIIILFSLSIIFLGCENPVANNTASEPGTLKVSVDWPKGWLSNPSIQAKLTPKEGKQQDVSDKFSINDNVDRAVATYNASLDDGIYTLSLSLLQDSVTTWKQDDEFEIKSGETSQKQYSLTAEYWSRTYGGSGSNDDTAYSIHENSDGGYIVAGYTLSFGAGSEDYWILKVKSDGTVAWQKAYGGADWDRAHSIRETSDGGFIVAGKTQSFGAGVDDYWILKLNSDGTVAWQKTYGGTGTDIAYDVRETSDGGYIVAGETASYSSGSRGAWIVKLNSDGTVSWEKVFGGAGTVSDYARSIEETSDNGFIVAGDTSSFGAGNDDYWLLKLKSDGTIAWQKAYGGTGNDNVYSIQELSSGGFIVAGKTQSFGAGSDDYWILKLQSDGTIDWQKSFGGTDSDYATSIIESSSGGFIVSGRTVSFGNVADDYWILKLNNDSSVAWQKTYDLGGSDLAWSIQESSDNGYVVAGVGSHDYYVLKVQNDGTCPPLGADTSVTPGATSATVSNTSVTAQSSSATIKTTNATVTDTSATVNQQAP